MPNWISAAAGSTNVTKITSFTDWLHKPPSTASADAAGTHSLPRGTIPAMSSPAPPQWALPNGPELFIGLMSGTSLDGIDGVLCSMDAQGTPSLLAHAHTAFTHPTKALALQLNTAGFNELHFSAQLAAALAQDSAQVCQQLLTQTGTRPEQVRAIASHGQTVRHAPQTTQSQTHPNSTAHTGYTVQVNNPALLAELTHIDVVADFRSRDIAAGGQGAPLVPAFHQHVFGRTHENVAVLNIGGMANISLLTPTTVVGCDTGPGNVLLDTWVNRHTGADFDRNGNWAASGTVNEALLLSLLREPFFATNQARTPTSTGRDLFNAAWLDTQLRGFEHVSPPDVQATLGALTARTAAAQLQLLCAQLKVPSQLLVCGGGAYNQQLLQQLRIALPTTAVDITDGYGLPAMQVEACAFAWLAWCHINRRPANVIGATGAAGPRVLGALYPR